MPTLQRPVLVCLPGPDLFCPWIPSLVPALENLPALRPQTLPGVSAPVIRPAFCPPPRLLPVPLPWSPRPPTHEHCAGKIPQAQFSNRCHPGLVVASLAATRRTWVRFQLCSPSSAEHCNCQNKDCEIKSHVCRFVLQLGPSLTRYSTIWPVMDPAHTPSPLDRLNMLEETLRRHEAALTTSATEAQQSAENQAQALAALGQQMQHMAQQLSRLSQPIGGSAAPEASVPAPVPDVPALPRDTPETYVGIPERYDGGRDTCNPFIVNCTILFALQPRSFSSEEAKVAFMVNRLTGRARLWGTAEWERRSPACASFELFSAELRKVFGPVSSGPESVSGLMEMDQGGRTVADYSIDFRTRSSRSTWNPSALCKAFVHGLADYVKDELVSYAIPPTLDELIKLATGINHRFQARRQQKRRKGIQVAPYPGSRGGALTPDSSLHTPPAETSEPMQLGRTTLPPEEKDRRRRANLCLYCGGAGHFASGCPAKARAHQ